MQFLSVLDLLSTWRQIMVALLRTQDWKKCSRLSHQDCPLLNSSCLLPLKYLQRAVTVLLTLISLVQTSWGPLFSPYKTALHFPDHPSSLFFGTYSKWNQSFLITLTQTTHISVDTAPFWPYTATIMLPGPLETLGLTLLHIVAAFFVVVSH